MLLLHRRTRSFRNASTALPSITNSCLQRALTFILTKSTRYPYLHISRMCTSRIYSINPNEAELQIVAHCIEENAGINKTIRMLCSAHLSIRYAEILTSDRRRVNGDRALSTQAGSLVNLGHQHLLVPARYHQPERKLATSSLGRNEHSCPSSCMPTPLAHSVQRQSPRPVALPQPDVVAI